jgi:hypothetical protein
MCGIGWLFVAVAVVAQQNSRLQKEQHDALFAIYRALGCPASSSKCAAFNQSAACPTTFTRCANQEVVYLDLSSTGSSGSIPTQIGLLTGLTMLLLFKNELLSSLPSQLGKLRRLERLVLSGNFFSGRLPDELFDLTTLTYLSFAQNGISGSLSPRIAQLRELNTLWAASNKLDGSIPVELATLSKLTSIWLSSNRLTGSLAPELGRLTLLEELFVETNFLDGVIPSTLSSLPLLASFWATANRLRGPVPLLPALARPDNGTFSCFLQFPNSTETNCFSECVDARCVCGEERCPYFPPRSTEREPAAATTAAAATATTTAPAGKASSGAVAALGAGDILPIALGASGAVLLVAIALVVCCIVQRRRANKSEAITIANSQYSSASALPLPSTSLSLPSTHSLPTAAWPQPNYTEGFSTPPQTPVTTYRVVSVTQYQPLQLSPYASVDI